MSGPTAYLTEARPAVAEVEVTRSRFLCRDEPVTTEEQARAVVEEERRRYWDARHHCSAFVLGPAADVQRSNDDGEPSGTAGAPMLEVLRGREVSDVVETPAGLFIVRPTARTEVDPAEFEEQKTQLRMVLQLQQGQQEVSRFVQSLREDARILDNRNEVLTQGRS